MSSSLRRLTLVLTALILISASCKSSFPSLVGNKPTPTPQPLPPALVETDPAAGSQVPLDQPISLYFNQAMDKASVEAAFSVDPQTPGTIGWTDDATLVFTPGQPLTPESALNFTIAASAHAANGLNFLAPAAAAFSTAEYLRLTHNLPETGTNEALPTGAVTASFNQPVVSLGADPSTLPAAFTLSPGAQGHGEWINTSTYVFYPAPGLDGGVAYTATVNPDLRSNAGSPLDPDSSAASWSFTTALPSLVSLEPASGANTPLDAVFKLTFNEPMDITSVETALSLTDASGQLVAGKGSWDEKDTVYSFTPGALLTRDTDYRLTLAATASARGGASLGQQVFDFHTYPDLAVAFTQPGDGATKRNDESLLFQLSSPLPDYAEVTNYVTLSPEVPAYSAYYSPTDEGASGPGAIWVYGNFAPDTAYTATISEKLTDKWNQALRSRYTLNFRTAPAQPSFNLPYVSNTGTYFLRPDDPAVEAQGTNITHLDLGLAPLSLEDYLRLTGPDGYNYQQSYRPSNYQTWTQPVDLPTNQSQSIPVDFAPSGGGLAPGLYYATVSSPEGQVSGNNLPIYLAVGDTNLTFTTGSKDALVWAMDLRTGQPMANAPVKILDAAGATAASGSTDADGLWHGAIASAATPDQYYQPYYTAMLASPGDADFGLASNMWNVGINSYDFGLPSDLRPEHPYYYLYTDRPMYRSGQTVYFRGVARQIFDGRYRGSGQPNISFTLSSPDGSNKSFTLPLSSYGTFAGQYVLPESAQPGYYSFGNDQGLYGYFQVADYRKPEINLSLQIDPDQTLASQPPSATVSAQYYFGAPVGNLPVSWALYGSNKYVSLPGYNVGTVNTDWLNYSPGSFGGNFGDQISSGEVTTGPDGTVSIPLTNLPVDPNALDLTLEISAQDESGLPLSARESFSVHPAKTYIGIQPDQWLGQAGTEMGFSLLTVDWDQKPVASQPLTANFKEVEYERSQSDPNNPYGVTYTPSYTPVDSARVTTGSDGTAQVAFTPPQAGTYILEVTGGRAMSQSMVWVGGPEQAAWPALPQNRIRMIADQTSYKAGDTAKVFVPNPLGQQVLALVAVERGTISDAHLTTIPAGGGSVSIPLTAESAPNIYVSVTLAGSDNDFRYGLTSLEVEPAAQTLHVEVTSEPKKAGPGEDVSFDVRVTDDAGKPVQGEFSFAVVDLAALALADPNAPDILTAFYAPQPIGVQTGVTLSAYGGRESAPQGGGGGGGGGEPPQVVRENFPDTAYWTANLVTDADGRATVKLKLPDNLTTWNVVARGLTQDTQVGEATALLLTTKDLLIRPVTPRFFVVGDRAELSAVVNNNTDKDIDAEVSLEAKGFTLDEPSQATQTVTVPAGGRARVAWPGVADNAESVDLVFSVRGGGLEDAAAPANGALPILHYTAPQAFVTSGLMTGPGTQLELVSLPRSFSPTGGRLDVELAPSLGYSILHSALEAEYPEDIWSVDQIISYMLPALASEQALKSANALAAADAARLQGNVTTAIQEIISFQNPDGGWGWCKGCQSDLYVSSYALMALQMAQDAGYTVSGNIIQNAHTYVAGARPYLSASMEAWQLDRLAFADYALQISSGVATSDLDTLYGERDRLSPWAQAQMALAIADASPGDPRAAELLSNLETTAIRTSSGVHWESGALDWHNPGTPIFTTSVVLYALAESGSSTPLAADALRYLASNRDANGWWNSAHDSAWASLASSSAMQSSGDLSAGFAYSSELNGQSLAEGTAKGPSELAPASATTPLSGLYSTAPNALIFSREEGAGTLFYRAALHAERPVQNAPALSSGMTVSRDYVDASCAKDCPAITSIALEPGAQLQARVTLTLPNDAYYLALEDYIPGGAEILNTSLKTTAQGEGSGVEVQQNYDPENPYADGWGWWLFNPAQIYDDHITFTADYLPAGTYVLTYTLVPLQSGEYQVLPTRAWQTYFPEVQATSAGAAFEIK
jgi:alpha-2-macroglobulin